MVLLVLVSGNLFGIGNDNSVGTADYETFTDLENLLTDETSSYTLLDVRTIEEYEAQMYAIDLWSYGPPGLPSGSSLDSLTILASNFP